MDVYSRYVVGWMVAHRESATLAQQLLETCCEREGGLARFESFRQFAPLAVGACQ